MMRLQPNELLLLKRIYDELWEIDPEAAIEILRLPMDYRVQRNLSSTVRLLNYGFSWRGHKLGHAYWIHIYEKAKEHALERLREEMPP